MSDISSYGMGQTVTEHSLVVCVSWVLVQIIKMAKPVMYSCWTFANKGLPLHRQLVLHKHLRIGLLYYPIWLLISFSMISVSLH